MRVYEIGRPERSLLWLTKGLIIIISFFWFTGSHARGTSPQTSEVEQLKQLFAKQQAEYEKQRQLLLKQGQQIEELKAELKTLSGTKAKAKTPPVDPPSKIKPATKTAKNTNKSADNAQLPSKPVGKKPPESKQKARPPEIPRLSDTVGGVLTRNGNLVVEPSVQYFFSDNNRVFLDAFTFLPAIAIGLIDIREIKRHSLIGNLTFRYGLTDRLEMGVKVPYVYRVDEQRSRPVSIGVARDEIFNASGSDIGDLEFTARYQLNSGLNNWPIFVGNLSATIPTGKSPFDVNFETVEGVPGAVFPTELATGSGFYSVQPNVTALYPTDPVVFFSSLSYSFNIETKEDIGTFDPGDTIGLSFGMGVSMNDKTSFSIGYSHKYVFNSSLDGTNIQGSNLTIGQLLIGYSYKYSKKTLFNLSLGIGVTDDSPDLKLDFRVPLTFDVDSLFAQ